jgi:putative resolvase
VVTQVGSGITEARPQLVALRADQGLGVSVVEHQDRWTRLGLRSLDTLRKNQGRAIAVVNQAEHGTAELLADLRALVSSFCARLAALWSTTGQAQNRGDRT